MDKSIHSKEYAVFLRHLRQARKKAGMTQAQLARRLTETQSFVSKCERGERRLDFVEVRRICTVLQIDFPNFVARVHGSLARGKGSRLK